jgi:hypothetical protein
LRVRGIENLRVADASVLPTVPHANTNLAAILVGEIAARDIAGAAQAWPTARGRACLDGREPEPIANEEHVLHFDLLIVGTCTIKAVQAGTAIYNPATTVSRSFSVVTKLNQTITFAAITAKTLAQSGLTVGATASSGLAVTLTSTTPTVCTVSGTTITLATVGTCSIKAVQAGTAIYIAAPTITRSFGVSWQSIGSDRARPGPTITCRWRRGSAIRRV